jgi:hypothetical protein
VLGTLVHWYTGTLVHGVGRRALHHGNERQTRRDENRRDEARRHGQQDTYTDLIPASSRATTRASAPKSSGSDARTRASQRRPFSDRSPETSSCTAASQSECARRNSTAVVVVVASSARGHRTLQRRNRLPAVSDVGDARQSCERRWERDCPLLEPGACYDLGTQWRAQASVWRATFSPGPYPRFSSAFSARARRAARRHLGGLGTVVRVETLS